MNDAKLLECFKILSSEARDLYLRRDVPVIELPVSPLDFYRDWVSPNLPVVVKNAIQNWPATTKWTHGYLRDKIGDKIVMVAATPNGYADAIADGYFVMPEERKMTVNELLSVLEDPNSLPETVLYVQSQNGNLSEDWIELVEDCESELSWATEAFGDSPTAANFWMGDERAVTSMHRDPFENIYCVVRGHKDFILHPPTDLPWIPYATLPTAKYQCVQQSSTSSKFKILPLEVDSLSDRESFCSGSNEKPSHLQEEDKAKELCDNSALGRSHLEYPAEGYLKKDSKENLNAKVDAEIFFEDWEVYDNAKDDILVNSSTENISPSHVPWICLDPEKPDYESYPLYNNATPVRVRVNAGDVLFLPAYWFHHVRQSHACIAVNFWYDVRFDHRQAYQAFVTSLLRKSNLKTGCPPL